MMLRAGAARSAVGADPAAELCWIDPDPDTDLGNELILFEDLVALLTAGAAASTDIEELRGVAVGVDTGSDATDCRWSVPPDKTYMRTAMKITPTAERERTVRVLLSAFVGNGTAGWIAIFDPQ